MTLEGVVSKERQTLSRIRIVEVPGFRLQCGQKQKRRIRGPIRQLPCTTEALGDQAEHDGKSRSIPVMERGTSLIKLTFPNLVDNNRRAKWPSTVSDRYFGSQHALQQHLNSPAHVFECDECDRSFGSQQSLDQHLNSPAHTPEFECEDCDRSFGSQLSLDQHLNSLAHAPVYECNECDRAFGSQQSLSQHLNSAAHTSLYKCDECDRWCGSPQALQQHYKSPAHAPVYECDDCDRSFDSQHALN
jgi:uncharacterized C2H2 Zn-finger protein